MHHFTCYFPINKVTVIFHRQCLLNVNMIYKCTSYRPQRSCGQGNIFAPVCHSVHGGGLPQSMLGYPPGQDLWHTPLWHIPRSDTPPSGTTPLWKIPLWHPPPAYGEWVASTHPSGMHSSFYLFLTSLVAGIRRIYKVLKKSLSLAS